MSSKGTKRPRADLLSSLDEAFASTAQSTSSKYTRQAVVEVMSKGNNQQASCHSKRKRKDKKSEKERHGNDVNKKDRKDEDMKSNAERKIDPLYRKLDVELLALGLKDCSLNAQVHTMANPRKVRETLKTYLELVTKGTRADSNAVGSLRNKVLSLDNPFKTSAAENMGKSIESASKKQTAKLLSARRRRELGLHLLSGEMKYSDAKQLNDIWIQYVSQVIESELSQVERVTDEAQRARHMKLYTKLQYLDLSGCPLEVIQSTNPCNVGLRGIVVAETQQTVQTCCPPSVDDDTSNGSIRTLRKCDSRYKVHISSTRCLILDGAWFAERAP